VLLNWAEAVAGKVDPTLAIEDQLSSLQQDFASRLDAITAAIEPVREVAQRTLQSLSQAPTPVTESSPVVSTNDPGFIAIVVLLAVAFAGTVVGDEGVGGALTIMASLLALLRNHKTEG
jgi:BarA-like signal transduction histidine kinase